MYDVSMTVRLDPACYMEEQCSGVRPLSPSEFDFVSGGGFWDAFGAGAGGAAGGRAGAWAGARLGGRAGAFFGPVGLVIGAGVGAGIGWYVASRLH